MDIKILIDNLACDEYTSEWGLSILIKYEGKNILLDTGQSAAFAANAELAGIDLADIDAAVLSHAHYDHADGMGTFFEKNSKAKFWLRKGSAETCCAFKANGMEYIGIKPGTLAKYADRIEYAEGDCEIMPGVWLVPHKVGDMHEKGVEAQMYLTGQNYAGTPEELEGELAVDEFRHEQSLIFRTGKGLVIFNSCSHGGADNIVMDAAETFPGEKLYAMIGGFHLYKTADDKVREFAHRLEATGIEHVITGHCTGERAYEILKEELGDKVTQMYSGLELEF